MMKTETGRDGHILLYRFQITGAPRPRQCEGNEKEMAGDGTSKDMPFDVKRMAYGGFNAVVGS